MNAIVIEDEPLVCDYLVSLISKHAPDITVVATLDTVSSAVQWFKTNNAPDVAFMDIRLADGLSFEIFELCVVPCPVIFTTAYDEYAVRAFKVNSVDYLLKPIQHNDLELALRKLRTKNIAQTGFANNFVIPGIARDVQTGYKNRFVIKINNHLRIIPIEDILYFYSHEKSTWLCTKQGRQYPIEICIDNVEECILPQRFFRINRKYLVSLEAIEDIIVYSGSRLQLKLPFCVHFDKTIVSRERVSDFKNWIDS